MYPELESAISEIKWAYKHQNCKKFIIASGQWPASRLAWENEKYGKPFSFSQMYTMFSAILRSNEIFAIDPDIQIYMRTIHLNPLGNYHTYCGEDHRPKDWRSPTVIDGYNLVIQELVEDV